MDKEQIETLSDLYDKGFKNGAENERQFMTPQAKNTITILLMITTVVLFLFVIWHLPEWIIGAEAVEVTASVGENICNQNLDILRACCK